MAAVTVERIATPRGELALRRDGPHFEIVSNGVFCMDTRGGASERLLVRATLDRARRPRSLLLGGLGVGFSLAEAVAEAALARIVVVELEEAVLRWHREHLAAVTGEAWRDPRVRLVHADVVDWLAGPPSRFDTICLDVDNGPGWTVRPANAALYSDASLVRCAAALSRNGALGVWSAHADLAFHERLRARFASVDVHSLPAPRGEPDRVYVGARPRSI